MPKRTFLIACSKLWIPKIATELEQLTGHQFKLITNKDDLNLVALKSMNPEAIFFPHWSHLIPEEIHSSFNCIIFHMTDLPYGRGGSPLQNLIIRGHNSTKVSALKCVKGLDEGPIFLKEDLSLTGTAQEIYVRATHTIINMIVKIIQEEPSPHPQEGDITLFQRRKPEQSNLDNCKDIIETYNMIRMLDADGYPKAFISTDNGLRYEFSNAKMDGANLVATVRILHE